MSLADLPGTRLPAEIAYWVGKMSKAGDCFRAPGRGRMSLDLAHILLNHGSELARMVVASVTEKLHVGKTSRLHVGKTGRLASQVNCPAGCTDGCCHGTSLGSKTLVARTRRMWYYAGTPQHYHTIPSCDIQESLKISTPDAGFPADSREHGTKHTPKPNRVRAS